MKTVLLFLLMPSVAFGADGTAPAAAGLDVLTRGFLGAIAGAAAFVRWPALRTNEGVGGALMFGMGVGILAPMVLQLALVIGLFYGICKLDLSSIVERVFDGIANTVKATQHGRMEELRVKQRAAESLAKIAGQRKPRKRKRRPPHVVGPSPEELQMRKEAEIEEARREAAANGFSQEALNQQIEWIRSNYRDSDRH